MPWWTQASDSIARLTEDADVRMREAADVRQNARQIGGADPEPCREGRGKFVDRRCWNPATLSGIIRTVDGERRKRAEQSAALDSAAENELVTAPAVIRTGAICRIGSAEIRSGESRDLRRYPKLNRRRIECA